MPEYSYDDKNIFAKILKGELPCEKVFEDQYTFAIMDIMPRADGHVLVLPKRHCRNMLDADTVTLAQVMDTTQRIARAQMLALNADGITMQQFNETAGGQIVFHLHMHVIPRFENIKMRPHSGEMADANILKTLATKLRSVL
ncbi:MAG: HIT family protein [Cohaesibacteraceae bacterium]|nr:HIT family protein [Cohaesibacteraceae bacterium]MBL4876594.1 HIT family protein [Cohaesibacteraceae bacterium]